MNPFDQFDTAQAEPAAPTSTLGGAELMQGASQAASAQPAQAANPFDQFEGQQAQQQQQPQAALGGWFTDGVEAMNRQFSKMALGTIDLAAAPFAAAGSTTAQGLRQNIANVNTQQEASLQQAQERSPWATGVGTVAGAIGSGLAYGGAGAGGVASLAGVSALQGGLSYAPSVEDRVKNAGIAGAVGGALGLGGKLVGQVKGALFGSSGGPSGLLQKALSPESAAVRDVGYLASKTGTNVDEALAASNNLGIPLTPAQALGGKALGSLESGIDPSIANKGAILDFTNPQSKAIKDLTKATLDDFTPMGVEKTEGRVFQIQKSLIDNHINAKDAEFLQSLPIVKQGLQDLSDPSVAGNIASLGADNVAKLQAVKRGIDDKLFNDTMAMVDPSKKLSGVTKDALHEAKDYIQKTLGKYGDYAERDKLAQALAIRGRYTKLLDKKVGAEGGGELSNDNIHQVLWSTPAKVDYFLKDVATTGGDVAKARDLIKLSQQTYKSAIEGVLGKQENALTAKSGVVRDFLDSITKGRYDAALLNLTLGGNQWASKIGDVMKATTQAGKEKGFMSLVGDVLKQGTTVGASRLAADSSTPSSTGYLQ